MRTPVYISFLLNFFVFSYAKRDFLCYIKTTKLFYMRTIYAILSFCLTNRAEQLKIQFNIDGIGLKGVMRFVRVTAVTHLIKPCATQLLLRRRMSLEENCVWERKNSMAEFRELLLPYPQYHILQKIPDCENFVEPLVMFKKRWKIFSQNEMWNEKWKQWGNFLKIVGKAMKLKTGS